LIRTPASFRTVPARIRIADTLAALCYAQENLKGAVKTRVVLDREVYRAHMEATRELLPGVAT